MITTVVGSGNLGFGGDGGAATSGQLLYPYSVAVDAAGNLYVADTNDHRVRKAVTPQLPPSGLSATRSSNSTVSLNWVAAPGATSYAVKRGTSSGAETVLASGIVAANRQHGPVRHDLLPQSVIAVWRV